MKLWKKILIVVSIILCVGLLGASIARTAVKPVTVGRSGSGSSSSDPAATQPAQEPQIEYVNDGKIYILVTTEDHDGYVPVVYEGDQVVQPVSVRSITRADDHGYDDSEEFNVYRVTPGSASICFEQDSSKSEAKTGDLRAYDSAFEYTVYISSGSHFEDISGNPSILSSFSIVISLDMIFLVLEAY